MIIENEYKKIAKNIISQKNRELESALNESKQNIEEGKIIIESVESHIERILKD